MLLPHTLRSGNDSSVVRNVQMQELDGAGEVLGCESGEGGVAFWERAAAKEDMVGPEGEELGGEFEADASVC